MTIKTARSHSDPLKRVPSLYRACTELVPSSLQDASLQKSIGFSSTMTRENKIDSQFLMMSRRKENDESEKNGFSFVPLWGWDSRLEINDERESHNQTKKIEREWDRERDSSLISEHRYYWERVEREEESGGERARWDVHLEWQSEIGSISVSDMESRRLGERLRKRQAGKREGESRFDVSLHHWPF